MAILIWWKQGGKSGVSSGFNRSRTASTNDASKHSVEKKSGIRNSNSKIVFKPLPIDDPVYRCPVLEKAKRILNWGSQQHHLKKV
ncbi:hypothetical protein LCGC14_1537720 [marine sediment metagenome]|uniref:Uncharacterized protein n=1 Tax=marine sediment metagenome TaxID=412755 RepID=A0A0F9JEZ5_9ZZZZ